ncbi:MAG TPA: DUF1127 domain-containing protein [Aurantimonas sp.]|jgi:uncharacterized protein YjiS (DUF1127 family)|nr:DUF1127 domain-containing protein [Aurantimonas sp.]
MDESARRPFWTGAKSILKRAFKRWQRGRAERALHLLDDHQLADIGIARNDIARAVDEVLERPGRRRNGGR